VTITLTWTGDTEMGNTGGLRNSVTFKIIWRNKGKVYPRTSHGGADRGGGGVEV